MHKWFKDYKINNYKMKSLKYNSNNSIFKEPIFKDS